MRKFMARLLGSIATKIAGIVGTMAALTAISVGVCLVEFTSVAEDMAYLAETQVPALESGTEVSAKASDLHDALMRMVLAPDPGALGDAARLATAGTDALTARLLKLAPRAAGTLERPVAALQQSLEALRAARMQELETETAIMAAVTELEAQVHVVGLTLAEQEYGAFLAAMRAAESAAHTPAPTTLGAAQAARGDMPDVQEAILQMRAATDLNLAASAFYAHALEAAGADDEAALMVAQHRMSAAATTIERLSKPGPAAASPPAAAQAETAALTSFAEFLDPVTGLVAKRRALLAARMASLEGAEESVLHTTEITAVSEADSRTRLMQIARDSRAIETDTAKATVGMEVLAAASLVIVALAAAVVARMILRPLFAVTRATSLLARGDLTALDGLRPQRGEIGQMMMALSVFRDGIHERVRLETSEAEARARHQEDQQRAAEAEQRREVQERERQAEHTRLEQAREAAETARREALQAEVEREREASAAAQERVVTAVAGGLRRLAEGDLRVQINEPFGRGYEQLRSDFNAAVTSLATAIGDIRDIALSIHSGSGTITAAAEDLSRRTEQSAATLEQSAAALTELTAAVGSAAEGAGLAARAVLQARQSAEHSNVVVKDAIAAMGEIRQSSSRISGIIGVIDDIAFQTNLLALNAGVEAARAGEAGRGFAVVASEVRALSQRSSEAAREISGLIADSSRHVGRGVDLVNQVGASLHLIVGSITSISQNVSAIAASAREQATGISEINITVSRLDQSTQQNAGMVEETTAASRDLTGEADLLAQIIQRFTVDDAPAAREAWGEVGPAGARGTAAA